MSRIVRVLPDEPAVDKEFDYLLPNAVVEASPNVPICVGTLVRIDLRGRRVKGWITDLDVTPPEGVTLSEVKKVSGVGPSADLVELAKWASQQWLGSRVHFLRTAPHSRIVPSITPSSSRPVPATAPNNLAAEAFRRGGAVGRTPPTSDDFSLAIAAASQGRALLLVPTLARAQHLLSLIHI